MFQFTLKWKDAGVLTLLFVSSLALGQSNTPRGFLLNGDIQNVPDSSWVFLNIPDHSIDSTRILDGKFQFSGYVSGPEFVNLKIPATADYTWFWIENKTMSIHATSGLFRWVKISGSSIQKKQDELNRRWLQHRDKTDSVAYLLRDSSLTDTARAALHATYTNMRQNQYLIYIDWIREDPNSVISLMYLENFKSIIGRLTTIELFNLMNDSCRNSEKGKTIKRFIDLNRELKVGDPYVDFVQNDPWGQPFRLSGIHAPYLLLNFWASWCGSCRIRNRELLQLYLEFNLSGFEIVAVALEKEKDAWVKAIEKDQLPWLNVSDLKYGNNEVAWIYGIIQLPNNVLINGEGIIVGRNLSISELREYLSHAVNSE